MEGRKSKYEKWKQERKWQAILLILFLFFINIISTRLYVRWDLTEDKLYTLNDVTINLLQNIDEPIYVQVYLEGELPAGFRRLQDAIYITLENFRRESGNKIYYEFIDPFEDVETEDKRRKIIRELAEAGLQPTNLTVKTSEGVTEKIIFPGAIAYYKGRSKAINFLVQQAGLPPEITLNNSIALIEYNIARAIRDLLIVEPPTIAFTQGHGELTEPDISDLVRTLNRDYRVVWVNLREVLEIPKDERIDVVVVARPTIPFSEQDKFKLDQYLMNGGSILWLVEGSFAQLDSLRNEDRAFIAVPADVSLHDQLFKYGVRVHYGLVADMRCAPIPVVVGQMGGVPQQVLRPWIFFPILYADMQNKHPIVKNMDAVLSRFATKLDTTVGDGLKKTILLTTSDRSKSYMAPFQVRLDVVRNPPPPGSFNESHLPVAILVEGKFTSLFKNRLTEHTLKVLDSLGIEVKYASPPTKIIVVGDGDIARNELDRLGNPTPLGFYSYTGQTFANKEFLLNAIEYLWDKTGIIETRTREVTLRLLNKEKISRHRTLIQLANILLPLLITALIGISFNYWRYQKFAR